MDRENGEVSATRVAAPVRLGKNAEQLDRCLVVEAYHGRPQRRQAGTLKQRPGEKSRFSGQPLGTRRPGRPCLNRDTLPTRQPRSFAAAIGPSPFPGTPSLMHARINQLLIRNPRVKRLLKAAQMHRLYHYLEGRIFFSKIGVLVEKDLSSLQPLGDAVAKAGLQVVRVTADALAPNTPTHPPLSYQSEKRHQKILRYLRCGYRGVALARSGVVVGDVWYWSPAFALENALHPDLRWLPISCGKDDVYGFDLVLFPGERGKNLANLVQTAALHEIRRDGFQRVFGYYWLDNLPALWVHRTLRWKEVRRVAVSRFYCFSHVT